MTVIYISITHQSSPMMDALTALSMSIATFMSRGFLVFGGLIPYVPLVLDINVRKDASKFSTGVPFFLLMSHSLRILYWFGHPFDKVFLYQSVVMIVGMFFILALCVIAERVRLATAGHLIQERKFTDFKARDFWAWTDFTSYVQAMIVLIVPLALTMVTFKNPNVVEAFGYASLITEVFMALPQCYKDFADPSSVKTPHIMMIILWSFGHLSKVFYYVWKGHPELFMRPIMEEPETSSFFTETWNSLSRWWWWWGWPSPSSSSSVPEPSPQWGLGDTFKGFFYEWDDCRVVSFCLMTQMTLDIFLIIRGIVALIKSEFMLVLVVVSHRRPFRQFIFSSDGPGIRPPFPLQLEEEGGGGDVTAEVGRLEITIQRRPHQ